MKYTKLGDLLVDAGVIDGDQLSGALANQKITHKRLGEELIDSGVITERQLIGALTMQLGIDYVDLSNADLPPELTSLVPKNIAKKHSIVPIKVQGADLYLAMVDPLNFIASEEAKAASRKHVIPVISTRASVEHAISALYGTEGAKKAIAEMQAESEQEVGLVSALQSAHVDETGQAAPSIRLVDSIIERAVTDRASDIHIEPREDDMLVRMRIDGVLHGELTIPKELQSSVIARVKVMCGMDVTKRRIPQDGRALCQVRMREVDLRASTLPCVHGEKIVLRLLDRDESLSTAEGLGFAGVNLEKYNSLLTCSQGVILLVGPTGSGKSSTMYTMLTRLDTEQVNIITLEDPVEYSIPGVNQVQVNERTGMTFAFGLRAVLRQDPDIVSVGEIRDSETAHIAMRAAITGHLVLSTMHTGDAVSTLDRLYDIGIEPYVVASALKGVISQRLVRRVCPHCRQPYDPTDEELASLKLTREAGVQFYRGAGCPECMGTGYRGRTLVAEVLTVDDDVRHAIRMGATRDELSRIVSASGFVPIIENCRDLVRAGVTTTEEVFRTLNALE